MSPHRDVTGLVGRIELLKRKALARTIDPIIINFIEVYFRRRIMDFVFVWWETRPIPGRRVDLNHDQLIRGEIWRNDVDNLPRCISASSQAAANFTRFN